MNASGSWNQQDNSFLDDDFYGDNDYGDGDDDSISSLMRKAMHEPLFVEFVDECLRILEPAGQQLSDEQVS